MVREAIRKLEQEGYVIMMPRRGTYVSDISTNDVKEIFEIRSALESLATGLAARRIEPEELETLQNLLVEIEGYIEKNDIEKIVETDIKFHGLLYQVSHYQQSKGTVGALPYAVNVISRQVAGNFRGTFRNG